MANEQNLKRGNEQTQFSSGREAVENGKKGGIASAKAKQERKTFRETLSLLLSMPLDPKKEADLAKITAFKGLKGKNISVQEAILIAQVQKAMRGDRGSAEFVRDTVGEKPDSKMNLDMDVGVMIIDDISKPTGNQASTDSDIGTQEP